MINKKFFVRISAAALCMSLLLTGCDKSGIESVPDSGASNPSGTNSDTGSSGGNSVPMPSYGATVSVEDIKNAYGSADNDIMPLYNIDPTESFDFDFAVSWDDLLGVNAQDMVSVHTDPRCLPESEIYTYGTMDYTESGGTRVNIAPISGPLATDAETDDMLENGVETWGNASIYYIAVRYDTESETPTKLDKPKIIPFTVKHDLPVPTLKGVVDPTGRFKLVWEPVEGADSYNVYTYGNTEINRTGETNEPVAGAEKAYDVNGDGHLLKDANTNETEFDNFAGEGHGLAVHERSVTGEQYIIGQNYCVNGSYFVTAVFGDKESSLSNIVNTSDLILPYKPIDEDDIMMERYEDEAMLPKTMRVLNIDGSITERSIAYSFFWGNSYLAEEENLNIDTRIPEYQYTVEGTAISGFVTMMQENRMEIYADKQNGEAPTGHIGTGNSTSVKSDPENDTEFNPSADVPTIIEPEGEVSAPDDGSKSLVERQTANTEKHLESGKTASVENSEYAVFADSAEEEWLARNLMAGNETIPLEAFPSLQIYENLADVFQKVYYQNPYVLGVTSYKYDYAALTLNVRYCYTKDEIAQRQEELFSEANGIIGNTVSSDMSDGEKCRALYNYLNANTVYDDEAVEEAERNNYTKGEDWKDAEDAFNAYGIIVSKKGVCQSYALSYKLLCYLCGVEAKVVTGYLDNTLPHAWNAVKLDGEWYQTDCTNNETNCGIPFFLYEAGEDDLAMTGYTEDKMYELDLAVGRYAVADSDREYYEANGLCAADADEYKTVLAACLENPSEVIAIRYTGGYIPQDEIIKAIVEVYNMKGMEDKLATLGLGVSNSFILLINK